MQVPAVAPTTQLLIPQLQSGGSRAEATDKEKLRKDEAAQFIDPCTTIMNSLNHTVEKTVGSNCITYYRHVCHSTDGSPFSAFTSEALVK